MGGGGGGVEQGDYVTLSYFMHLSGPSRVIKLLHAPAPPPPQYGPEPPSWALHPLGLSLAKICVCTRRCINSYCIFLVVVRKAGADVGILDQRWNYLMAVLDEFSGQNSNLLRLEFSTLIYLFYQMLFINRLEWSMMVFFEIRQ